MSHGSALLRGGRLPPPTGPPPLTPYVRRFNGTTDWIKFSMGAIGTGLGYGTLATLARRVASANTWEVMICPNNAAGTKQNWSFNYEPGVVWMGTTDTDYGDGNAVTAPQPSDGWVYMTVTKANGLNAPNFGKSLYGTGSWQYSSTTFGIDNGSTVLDHILVGAEEFAGSASGGPEDNFCGDIALLAYWDSVVLTTPQIQTLDDAYAAWGALSPTWMVAFNQPSVSAVSDVTGGGGNQTAISGTSVVTSGPALPGYGA